MTTMAKLVLLLLVVFKATAFQTSPSQSPSPLSNAPFTSPSIAPSLSPFSSPPSLSPSSFPIPAPSPAPELETPPAPAPAVIPEVQTPLQPPPAPIVALPPPPTPVFPPPLVTPPGARELCAMECALKCMRKKFNFIKKICMGLCLLKCAIIPSDSIHDINCTLDCAQFSPNSFRYDANKMDDLVSSCYHQCNKD